jgi:quercetin dioxygenase-like cupin family protein
MDRAQFEAKLKAEGYPEIDVGALEPNCSRAEHAHHFDVSALVLEGEITLGLGGESRTYRAGDRFAMAAGCMHTEDVGPAGVRYVVGRR